MSIINERDLFVQKPAHALLLGNVVRMGVHLVRVDRLEFDGCGHVTVGYVTVGYGSNAYDTRGSQWLPTQRMVEVVPRWAEDLIRKLYHQLPPKPAE